MKLKKLIPLENPSQFQAWRDYLRFLLEYSPERVWHLFVNNKLEELLDLKATQIVNFEQELLKAGRAPDQAHEVAYEAFMPSDTDLPEQEMLSAILDAQEQKIWDWVRQIRSKPQRRQPQDHPL